MPAQNPVTPFGDIIFNHLQISALPEDAQAALREKIEEQVLRRLGLIILQHLDEEGITAYNRLMQDGAMPSSGEMKSFLEQYLPDYEEKIKDDMDKFIQEIVQIMQTVK